MNQSVMQTAAVCALLAAAPGALAWTADINDEGIQGALTKQDGAVFTGDCVMRVDRTVAEVRAALLDLDNMGRWMGPTDEFKVVRRTMPALVWRRAKGLPLIAGPTAALEVQELPQPDGSTRVTWHRTEGSISVFEAQWDLVAQGESTQVRYRVTMAPPMNLPAFLLKRVGVDVIVTTMKGLRSDVLKRPRLPRTAAPVAPVAPVAPLAAPDAGLPKGDAGTPGPATTQPPAP